MNTVNVKELQRQICHGMYTKDWRLWKLLHAWPRNAQWQIHTLQKYDVSLQSNAADLS